MRPLIANIVNAIRASGSRRGRSVREMRAETRATLSQHRWVRRAAGVAIRQALQRHRAAVIESVRAAFTGIDPAADRSSAETAVRRLPEQPPPREHTSVWELWPGTPAREDATSELLQALRVIHGHPEGICARDIGNELGIEWRRVPAITRSLLEAGLVEQVGQEYYPCAKPPRS
jgi:hypothetical protein